MRCASPGATTTSVTPSSSSAVTTARARSVLRHDRNPRTSASRASQCATRSGVAASRSRAAGSTVAAPTGRNPSTGSSGLGGHVGGEQLHGGEAARVRQLGQRGGQGEPGGDPDRGLERRGDDDGQPDVLGDPQAGADPAERLHLEHRHVGRLEVADPVGVLGPADRLVRGDRDVDPAAYGGEVLDRRRTAARRTPARRPPGPARRSRRPPRRPTTRRWRRRGPRRRHRARRAPPRAGPRRRPASGPARRP